VPRACFGTLGKSLVTAGPLDVQLLRRRADRDGTRHCLDNQPIAASGDLLLSIPGYSLRALPDPGNHAPQPPSAQPQQLVAYPNHAGYVTADPTNAPDARKPSGDMNGGFQPTFWSASKPRSRFAPLQQPSPFMF